MRILEAIPDEAELNDLGASGEPLGASAALRPCALYVHTGASAPTITEGHHVHPVYLQNSKYGKLRDGTLIFLCGTCHDSVHAWLYFLMGDRKKPNPEPPPRCKALAQRAFDWFHS